MKRQSMWNHRISTNLFTYELAIRYLLSRSHSADLEDLSVTSKPQNNQVQNFLSYNSQSDKTN